MREVDGDEYVGQDVHQSCRDVPDAFTRLMHQEEDDPEMDERMEEILALAEDLREEDDDEEEDEYDDLEEDAVVGHECGGAACDEILGECEKSTQGEELESS